LHEKQMFLILRSRAQRGVSKDEARVLRRAVSPDAGFARTIDYQQTGAV